MNDVRPSLSPDGFRMILNWIISRIILRIMRPDVSFRFRSHEGGKKDGKPLKKILVSYKMLIEEGPLI